MLSRQIQGSAPNASVRTRPLGIDGSGLIGRQPAASRKPRRASKSGEQLAISVSPATLTRRWSSPAADPPNSGPAAPGMRPSAESIIARTSASGRKSAM